jgi:predicted DNA-binding transcriptional regulator YafY
MDEKPITRLIKLLKMLQFGVVQNRSGLAKSFGVDRRTISRYFDTLRKAGVPVKYDRKARGYYLPGASYLPPTDFTADEALSLLALAAEHGRKPRLPLYEAAFSAAAKLEASLPAPLRNELRGTTRAINIRMCQTSHLDGKSHIHQQLVAAISNRNVARIEYESFTEWERISTKLRPYQLLFSRRSWYVIGRSSLHREVRIFNLSRMISITMLRERFTMPRNFDLDKYLRNAWHLIPGAGRDAHVKVRFKPLVAGNVAEVLWHKTQRTKLLDDGSLEFTATVSGLNEIAWWILGYGDQAEVLQPAKLRQLIAQRARNMAAMYNGG